MSDEKRTSRERLLDTLEFVARQYSYVLFTLVFSGLIMAGTNGVSCSSGGMTRAAGCNNSKGLYYEAMPTEEYEARKAEEQAAKPKPKGGCQ